jgi:DNA-binding MarR family transcriptional regulator
MAKVRGKLGSVAVTVRLTVTALEQVEDMRREQNRSRANMLEVLVEERLAQIRDEQRQAAKK